MVYSKGMENTVVYKEFMAEHARSKNSIIKKINKKINEYMDVAEMDHSVPEAFYTLLLAVLKSFVNDIENAVLFEELPDWWIYDYDLEYDHFSMFIEHIAEIEIDDKTFERRCFFSDARYELVRLPFRMLSVSDYASQYNVEEGTVRQWIRRGKIRTCSKVGSEWRIPILTVPPKRGYESAQYTWQVEMEDLPEEYKYLNDYKLATFYQDRELSDKYHVFLTSKNTTKRHGLMNKELILDAKEREKLELIMIARPEIRYCMRY